MLRDDPYPYYERDGTRITIDHATPEGREKLVELWSHQYRRVAQDYVGDVHVSTVFLPIDHGWQDWRSAGPEYKPILFETMVFGYDSRSALRRLWDTIWRREWGAPDFQWRYATEKAALAGHRRILEAVERGTLKEDTIPYFTEEES